MFWLYYREVVKGSIKIYCASILLIGFILGWNSSAVKGQGVPPEDGIDQVSASSEWLTVDKIFIIGNNKTREKIILRELDITEGQTVNAKELEEIIKVDRRKLMNTRLFLAVHISPVRLDEHTIDVIIRVTERWYTIPSPFFRLADRNFNVWLTTENRDWRRVEYGLKFFQYNFRGLNERLYLHTQLGFTRQFSLRYVIPYIDKAQKNGIELGFSYSEKKNINYVTRDHQLIFTDSLAAAQQNFRALLGWRYRPNFYHNHFLDLRFTDNLVSDTITLLNPDYFLNGDNRQRYFSLAYSFVSDHRDYVGYPLKGYHWEAGINKLGLGIFNDVNILRVTGSYSRFLDLGKGFYFAGSAQGYFSGPRRQPYANFIGLGYNHNWLRGYELEVIEGQAYILQQNTIKKKILAQELDLRNILSIEQFNTIPIDIYITGFVDQGYLSNSIPYEQSNRLANQYLMGYGVGVDLVSFYDFVLRVERSWKLDGKPGFYFHMNAAF